MSWLRLVLVFLVLGILVTGCDSVLYPRFEKSMWSSYMRMQEVQLGMTQGTVESIMGKPNIQEEGDYRGGHYVFWFYLTHSMDYTGGLHTPGLPARPPGGHRPAGLQAGGGASRRRGSCG